MHCWGFCIPHLWYLLAHLSSTTCWLLTVGIELLLSEPQIFTSVKTSNACLIGLLSVSQELIPRKFLSSCLSHALNIMPVSKVAQLCPTHCDPMDCSLPGSSIHGIFQVSTGVGCHFLLQEIFLTQGSNPGLPHCRQTLLPSELPGKP